MRPIRPLASLRALVVLAFSVGCANDPDGRGGQSGWLLEGRLETIGVEGEQGATKHFLIPDDGSDPIELWFDVDPGSGSGSRIGVNGRFEGARFRVAAFDDALAPSAASSGRQGALTGVTPERTRTVAFVR